jgi:hypothetical protein
MISGKPLEHPDGNGIIKLRPLAFGLARMKTNATAHHREGNLFPYDSYRLTRFTLGKETDITGYIDAGGTGLAAWCGDHTIAKCFNLNTALWASFSTGGTTAAPFLIPDKLSTTGPARNNQLLLRILRCNRATHQILQGNRHTLGYSDAIPFKPQPYLLLI